MQSTKHCQLRLDSDPSAVALGRIENNSSSFSPRDTASPEDKEVVIKMMTRLVSCQILATNEIDGRYGFTKELLSDIQLALIVQYRVNEQYQRSMTPELRHWLQKIKSTNKSDLRLRSSIVAQVADSMNPIPTCELIVKHLIGNNQVELNEALGYLIDKGVLLVAPSPFDNKFSVMLSSPAMEELINKE